MSAFPVSLEKLVEKFASLPGIGTKSAQRLAFYVLALSDEEALDFANTIAEAKKNVHCCRVCQNLTDIMATNPDTEGEATAMYISRLLKPFGVKVTRLAYGIPVGSNLEYTDDATLLRALEGRREI